MFGGIDYSIPANNQTRSQTRQGFIVSGENGNIRVFHKSETDVRMPYKRVEGDDLYPASEHERENRMLYQDMMYHKTIGMALSPRVDTIVFTTDSG